jgi:hypothetical protein
MLAVIRYWRESASVFSTSGPSDLFGAASSQAAPFLREQAALLPVRGLPYKHGDAADPLAPYA